MKSLDKVIEHFGSVAALAEALDIERQAIYMWKGRIPELRAYQIERLTDGHFQADNLIRGNNAA